MTFRFASISWPLVTAVLAVGAFGCVPKTTRKPPYVGPTKPLAAVVADINSNNAKIDQLWARGSFRLWLRDPKGKEQYVSGDANLLYRRSNEFSLRGKLPAIGEVFTLGCNDEKYWMGVKAQEPSTLWLGSFDKLANLDPARLPVRPDLLLQVLAVNAIPTNLRQPPTPVLRFNNDEDVYMLVWSVPVADRWIATKEVWYDRETLRPRMVNLFDENGRVVLRAYLQNAKRVEGESAENERPTVATDYDLFFPPSNTKMKLHLSAVRFENDGAPNDATFRGPKPESFGEVIDLDAAK